MGPVLLTVLQPAGDVQLGLDEQQSGHSDDAGEQVLAESRQVCLSLAPDAATDCRQGRHEQAFARLVFQIVEQTEKVPLPGQILADLLRTARLLFLILCRLCHRFGFLFF